MVADRHRLAAYHDKHCWRAFRGYQHRWPRTTLNSKKMGFKWFCFVILGCDAQLEWFSLKYTGDRPRQPAYEIKLMLSRVSWALAQDFLLFSVSWYRLCEPTAWRALRLRVIVLIRVQQSGFSHSLFSYYVIDKIDHISLIFSNERVAFCSAFLSQLCNFRLFYLTCMWKLWGVICGDCAHRDQRSWHEARATTSAATLRLASTSLSRPRQHLALVRTGQLSEPRPPRTKPGICQPRQPRQRPAQTRFPEMAPRRAVASTTTSTVPATPTAGSVIPTDLQRWVVRRARTSAGASLPMTAATTIPSTADTFLLADSVTLTSTVNDFLNNSSALIFASFYYRTNKKT